jgi:type IV secretion system protein VirB3
MSPPLAFPGPSEVPGFAVPLHRSLTEPILLGGAPRAIAISVGTLAAAVGIGLQLWIAGLAIWIVGHASAVARWVRNAEGRDRGWGVSGQNDELTPRIGAVLLKTLWAHIGILDADGTTASDKGRRGGYNHLAGSISILGDRSYIGWSAAVA